MLGFARLIVRRDAIGVRFEQVGSRQKFNIVMNRFNQSFPLKEWDESKRLWWLPTSDLDALVTFCTQTFGVTGCRLEQETITA